MNRQTEQELLKIVKDNYRARVTRLSTVQPRSIWPELAKLTTTIKPGQQLLDVGCGNARLFHLLHSRDIDYTGVDNCQELLNAARQECSQYSKQPTLLKADVLDLNQLPQLNFDYVFCVDVLQHLPGQRLQLQALKQLKNKVTAQGRIVVTVRKLWSQAVYRRLIMKFGLLKLLKKNKMDWGDILLDYRDQQHHRYHQHYYHAFNRSQLLRLARHSGLHVERLYDDQFNYYLIGGR